MLVSASIKEPVSEDAEAEARKDFPNIFGLLDNPSQLKKAFDGVDLKDAVEHPQDYVMEDGKVVKKIQPETLGGVRKLDRHSIKQMVIYGTIIVLLILILVMWIVQRVGG